PLPIFNLQPHRLVRISDHSTKRFGGWKGQRSRTIVRWFAKMISQARSLRIINIQFEDQWQEANEYRVCNIAFLWAREITIRQPHAASCEVRLCSYKDWNSTTVRLQFR